MVKKCCHCRQLLLSMIAQIKTNCCPDKTHTKSIHNKSPISRLFQNSSGRNCAYKSLVCYICDTHRWRRSIDQDCVITSWYIAKYTNFNIHQSVVILILELRRKKLIYNSCIIIATHILYNYCPCVKGRGINNIRKYLPIFRNRSAVLVVTYALSSLKPVIGCVIMHILI